MSLYNALFGRNQHAVLACAVAGVGEGTGYEIPRFRDAYFSVYDDAPAVVVHTRTGGGNREEYALENANLASHPLYLFDADDEGDYTYANFVFRVPGKLVPLVQELLATTGPVETPAEKWKRLLGQLERAADDNSPEVQRALAVGEQIMASLQAALPKP